MPHGHHDSNTRPELVALTTKTGSYLSGLILAGHEARNKASASRGENCDKSPKLRSSYTQARGTKKEHMNSENSLVTNDNSLSRPCGALHYSLFAQGREKNKIDTACSAPTCGEGSYCFRSSVGPFLMLHRGATAG